MVEGVVRAGRGPLGDTSVRRTRRGSYRVGSERIAAYRDPLARFAAAEPRDAAPAAPAAHRVPLRVQGSGEGINSTVLI